MENGQRKRERKEIEKGIVQNDENGDQFHHKKQKLPSNPNDSVDSNGPPVERESILPGDKGFLIQYDAGNNHKEPVSEIIHLLNEYADKLYPTDKCFYFKEKSVGEVNQSVFIESNVDDPCVLVDAIFKDLYTGNTEVDLERVKLLYRFLPVNKICNAQCEDMMASVKSLLKPILADKKTGNGVRFKMRAKGNVFNKELREKMWVDMTTFITSKELPEACEQENNFFVCFNSLIEEFTQEVEGDAKICCITLTKNEDLFKGYCVKKLLTSKGKKAGKGRKTAVIPKDRGFLVSYNTNGNRGPFVQDALQVLNEYADKLYRTDGKHCYFEEKVLRDPKCSPIFFESDIDDPSLITDAIFADLKAGIKSVAMQKVQGLSRFVPVMSTCTIEYEDIIRNVKAVLEPVLTEIRSFNVSLTGNILKKDEIASDRVRKGISEYLLSRGVQGTDEQENDSQYLISIRTLKNGKLKGLKGIPKDICCVTVTKNGNLFKNYSISHFLSTFHPQT